MIEKSENLFPEVLDFFENTHKIITKSKNISMLGNVAGVLIKMYNTHYDKTLQNGIYTAIVIRLIAPEYSRTRFYELSQYLIDLFPFIDNLKYEYYQLHYHGYMCGIMETKWSSRYLKICREFLYNNNLYDCEGFNDYSDTIIVFGKINGNINNELKSILANITILNENLPDQQYQWEDDTIVSLETTILTQSQNKQLIKIFFDCMNSRTMEINKESEDDVITKYKKRNNSMRMWANRASIRSFVRS